MSSKRVLLICPDILPLPNLPTTGAGLRAWGVGKGLEACGHEVVYSMPMICLQRGYEVAKQFADHAWEMTGIDKTIRRAKPDIVVFSHWPSMLIERKLDIPTVLDFHGPHMLEREYQGFGHRAANAWHKVQAIRMADFFTCAGERQRLYFLGWLMAAGIRVTENDIASVAVCVAPDLPVRRWNDDEPVFVYGGVFLPWQDPSAGLRALIRCMEKHGRGCLKFFGGRHPVFDIKRVELFDDLGKMLDGCQRVERMGFVSHDQLIDVYCRSHVALDVMARNPERELAYTTRTVEYLWCGLPVIYHHYSELSGIIRDYEAGWVVDPTDELQISAAIEEALTCPAEVRRRGMNAQRLVRERLVWDRAVEPLDAFCRDPRQMDPLPMPMWDHNPKGLPTLLTEVVHNYHHGGIGAVTHYTTRYIKKQIKILQG